MSVLETIADVLESARKLRDVAGELNSLELKSQIIDQIGFLQDARDQLQLIKDGEDPEDAARAAKSVEEAKTQLKGADEGRVFLAAPSDGETYSFSIGESETTEPEAKESKPEIDESNEDESSEQGKSDADGKAKSDAMRKQAAVAAVGDSRLDLLKVLDSVKLTVEQQAKIAELRINELEPKHYAAVKNVNQILTDEQRKAKVVATKAAKEAGKSGKELQQAVQAAVKLTDEQKKLVANARKELQTVRIEIASQINEMLTDEQRAAIDAAGDGDSKVVKAKAVKAKAVKAKAVKVKAVKK